MAQVMGVFEVNLTDPYYYCQFKGDCLLTFFFRTKNDRVIAIFFCQNF